MPTLSIQLLGEFRLTLDGKPVTAIRSPRLQSLLAYLVLHREAPQSRQHLAFLFWPDVPESSARNNLRQLLFELRHALPQPTRFLRATGETIQWHADAFFSCDVDAFWAAMTDVQCSSDRRVALEKAVELYRGDLLPGCYDDWIAPERERVREQVALGLDQLVQCLEEQREYGVATRYAQMLLRHDPVRETTYQQLMRLHALGGDRAGVVRVFNTCVQVLHDELSVEPSTETRREYERALTAPFPNREREMESSASPMQHHFPHYLTRFIGREAEIGRVKQLIAANQLVTLLGAGGVGKTRLALQVAADQASDFQDGACWVDLAPLSDERLVSQRIASTLGVSEPRFLPSPDTLSDFLRDKEILLVLDNCEHLARPVSTLVQSLLRASPKLHILVTSRAALQLAGEVTWRVQSLSTPVATEDDHARKQQVGTESSELLAFESVQLFADRAISVLPTFSVTSQNMHALAEICRQLDGIPLAIELAAARVKILSVQDIAARLDHSFDLLDNSHASGLARQQTLHATMDWSYQLLSDREQRLFEQLSVFAGGFSVEAVEAVCGTQNPNHLDGQPACEILNLISSLCDKSLVAVQPTSEGRLFLLETVRQYAREKLLALGHTDRTRSAHLAYMIQLSERAEPHWHGAEEFVWLKRLECEHDNLRAALEFALETTRPMEALRLGALLWIFWYRRGHYVEGTAYLERALERYESREGCSLVARARLALGAFAWLGGDYAAAQGHLEQAIALARQFGAEGRLLAAEGLFWLGVTLMRRGEFSKARQVGEESLAQFHELDVNWGQADALFGLARVAVESGDSGLAHRLSEQSCAFHRLARDQWGLALALSNVGLLCAREANYSDARSVYQESLQLRRKMEDRWGIANSLSSLGEVARLEVKLSEAWDLYQECLRLYRQLGGKGDVAKSLHNLGYLALHRGDVRNALTLFTESLNLHSEIGNTRGIAECLTGFADLALHDGQFERTARLLGAADRIFADLGALRWPADQAEYARILDKTRSHLGMAELERFLAEGSRMPPDQAVQYTLLSVQD